jgi:hypothetical protein
MFCDLDPCAVDDVAIKALFKTLDDRKGLSPNRRLPAGFTYLGQFVDHDITFDPLSKLDQDNDPCALVNFRTPRFDLDSLYGSGPKDQPFLYDWDCARGAGAKLLVGRNPVDTAACEDLPRNQQGRALIGDSRNDENLIVAQLHLLFIHFHNAVVEHVLDGGSTGDELFDEAQRIVRWHYQWIVTHEFLHHVVGQQMAQSVLVPGEDGDAPVVRLEHYKWEGRPFIPVEFSGAAYRFGHSMVRDAYAINVRQGGQVKLFPTAQAPGPHLGGLRRLPADLVIEWQRFFALTDDDNDHETPQPSSKIDPRIVGPLFELPDGRALPLLNLQRSVALELPSGQDVAKAMHKKPLEDDQLLDSGDVPDGALRRKLLDATPLWFYILCEAAAKRPLPEGFHLGPVGGRIVAEVLVGLLEADPSSYLHKRQAWKPDELLEGRNDFTMADLVVFAGAYTPPAGPHP